MMQIIHDIAPGASLAFYTAFDSEQDFANGILALAAAGCKVICRRCELFRRAVLPERRGGAGDSNRRGGRRHLRHGSRQRRQQRLSGGLDADIGFVRRNVSHRCGELRRQPRADRHDQYRRNRRRRSFDAGVEPAYGAATSDLEILVFQNGSLVGTASNRTSGQEPNNPWVDVRFHLDGTYQVAIENLSGPESRPDQGDHRGRWLAGDDQRREYRHGCRPRHDPRRHHRRRRQRRRYAGLRLQSAQSESFSSSGAGAELSVRQQRHCAVFARRAQSGRRLRHGRHRHDGFRRPQRFLRHLGGVGELGRRCRVDFVGRSRSHAGASRADHGGDGAADGQFRRERCGPGQVDPAVAAAEALVQDSDRVVWLDQPGRGWQQLLSRWHQQRHRPRAEIWRRAVTAGEFGGWTPIGAEQTRSGYDVAWKIAGANQYTVWNTDSNGNYHLQHSSATFREPALRWNRSRPLSIRISTATARSALPTTVIESFGSTSLVEVGNNLFSRHISSGTGPELEFGGAALRRASSAAWTPIGAEQIAAAATTSPGKCRAPISIRCGTPTATATIVSASHRRPCREPAPRWNRWRPLSIRI